MHLPTLITSGFSLKDGIMYYSRSYQKSHGKRDNIHCRYRSETGEYCFGEIELFTTTPNPSAFIRQMEPLSTTLINRAGHPCRNSLIKYRSADLLSSYIVPVQMCTDHSPLHVIPIDSITLKVCIISDCNNHYCVVQPNSTERH